MQTIIKDNKNNMIYAVLLFLNKKLENNFIIIISISYIIIRELLNKLIFYSFYSVQI